MSSILSESFGSGSNGATITTSNTTADLVGGSPVFDNGHAVDGTLSMLCDVSAATKYVAWNFTSANSQWLVFYVWLNATPGATYYAGTIYASGVNKAELRIMTTGKLQARDNFVAKWTSNTVLTAGKWWRIAWQPGSDGGSKQRVIIYDGSSTTATEDTANLASGSRPAYSGGAFDRFALGPVSTSTGKAWFDLTNGDTTTEWTPSVAAPTIEAGTPQTVQDTHAAQLDSTASGTYSLAVWSVVSGPSTSSAQFSSTSADDPTFTPAGGAGSYVLKRTLTYTAGTVSDTVTITVTALTSSCSVVAVNTSAGWTASGGASSVLDALQGNGYLVSSSNPSSLDLDYTMSGMLPPGSGVNYTHTVPCRRNGGTSGTFDASLRKLDGTLVKKVTATTLPSGATRDATTVTFLAADITGMADADWNAGHRVLLEETAS